ncbi:MAG: TIGR00730 family Rossman fold protein [Cyanobacteria bacterium SIG30]|nr:TIGR00730 family Rossman fold protein [Cyanobacteria bacterium SIG30]
MKKICVFCSSSNNLNEIYHQDANKLGALLAQNNYELVYGGSFRGLMGEVALGAKNSGAKVTGIMPKKIFDFIEGEQGPCDNFVLTDNLRDRKQKLDEASDAFIALAGGFGTLDEIIEVLDLKILGYHNKPIIFLNTNHFYDSLVEFFENFVKQKFASDKVFTAFYVAQKPEDVITYLENYKHEEINLIAFKS